MATKLSTKVAGDIVKIKEQGVTRNFIVMQHDYPNSASGRTLVLRECVLPDARVWNSKNINTYANSDIDIYLNETYFYYLDPGARNMIKPTGIASALGNGDKTVVTISRRVFLLSSVEYFSSIGYAPREGIKIPYFSTDSRRKARDDSGSACRYWTRSMLLEYKAAVNFVTADGTRHTCGANLTRHIRPAFTLPSDTMVEDDGTVITNSAPSTPSSIFLPSTVKSGSSFTVSWSSSSDSDGNLQGYYLYRSLDGGSWSQIYQGSGTSTSDYISYGSASNVQYRVYAYDTQGASSGYCYSSTKTIVHNLAPSTPGSITVPLQLKGGESTTITWAASTDSDNNLSGYQLSRRVDGGSWSQIYSGSNRTYTDTITKGWTSVAYRVRAFDSYNEYSSYATSDTRIIDNNAPPVITCAQSGDLGEQKNGFRIAYSVSDADGDTVTVTEKLDDRELRTFTATLGQENVIAFEGTGYVALLNGQHVLTVTATDPENASATLTLTFSKSVHECEITLSENMSVDDIIKKTLLSVTRLIPTGAEFKVLVTNNANDPDPVWEDATNSVLGGRNHVFENTEAENGFAYNFKITANRGESGTGGYIGLIGGAFQ